MRVALNEGKGQIILPARPLDVLYAITLRPADADTAMTFDSRGFVANRTGQLKYYLTVGTLKDSVCVSRLGIVTKTNVQPYLTPNRFSGTSTARKALTPPSSA